MGVKAQITFEKFPVQTRWVGRRVLVCYHFDSSKTHLGTVVRDDKGEPYEMIIKLDNGRYVRSVECQYTDCVPEN